MPIEFVTLCLSMPAPPGLCNFSQSVNPSWGWIAPFGSLVPRFDGPDRGPVIIPIPPGGLPVNRVLPRTLVLSSLALLILPAFAFAAPAPPSQAAAIAPGDVAPAPEGAAPAPADEFVYGPIHASDPAVRLQIKKLYRDQADLEKATQAQLQVLVTALQNETDSDFQVEIQKQMIAAKKDLQIKSTEIGLQIARLNEDAVRVADYEKALDQLLNPEKYMPAVDPSIGRERAQAMGLEQ